MSWLPTNKQERKWYLPFSLALMIFIVFILLILCIIKNIDNNEITFPSNRSGDATPLDYCEEFNRITNGKKAASLTKYKNGFFGAYYGYLFYFDYSLHDSVLVNAPSGLYDINEIRLDGKEKEALWNVTGVFYDKKTDRLYVANYKGHNILVCDISYDNDVINLDLVGEYSFDGMESPENIYVKDNIIAVADYDGNALWIMDVNGNLINKADVALAHGVAISDDFIFVTSLMDRKIYKYSYSGELLDEVGHEGYEGVDSFMWPTGLDVTGEDLIVSDAHTGRIYLYDYNLNYVSSVGGIGPSDNALHFPYCANYFNHSIYIADCFNTRIVVLDTNGRIKEIWGDEIEGMPSDITFHNLGEIPYTYGISREVSSLFFNPLIKSDVTLGYDSLWFNNNGQNVQINSSDYKSNDDIFKATVPRLEQLYITWIKRIIVDNNEYYIIGSPERPDQLYIFNAQQRIFFVAKTSSVSPIWYVNGNWYCGQETDTLLTNVIRKSYKSQNKYIELSNMGIDRRIAYSKSFCDYYNSEFYNSENSYESIDTIKDPLNEDSLYSWIQSFFSTQSGIEFWSNYSSDIKILRQNTISYYTSTQYGASDTHLCELMMVKMLGEDPIK